MTRYQALDFNGKILATGRTLDSVQSFGKCIIIDYKKMRYTTQKLYPLSRQLWHIGIIGVSKILRRNN